MLLYIDQDNHQAIQSPGSRTPISSIAFKVQDTPSLRIYFVSQGNVTNQGESPVLKFALNLVAPAPIDILVLDTVFTRQVDAAGLTFYLGFPIFNTAELKAALGEKASIACAGEVRVQLASGEIFSTLDIPFTVYRTILGDTDSPPPVVVETYPAAAALELKTNKDQPSGYAGLDAGGLLSESVIPANVVKVEDAIEGVEMLATRDVALGHPSLDENILIPVAEIPIDGTTIVSANGKLSAVGPAQGVVATTTEPFTVPAVGANTPISIPTGSFMVGAYYIFTKGAGTYQFVIPIDSTHGEFKNAGGAMNAAAGTVIAFGANATLSGPPGASGSTPWAASDTINFWDSGTTYSGSAPASLVMWNSSLWVAVAPVLGAEPGSVNGQWWQISASFPGVDGAAGPVPWAPTSTILPWDNTVVNYTGNAPADLVIYNGAIWVAVTPVENVAPGSVPGQWLQITVAGPGGPMPFALPILPWDSATTTYTAIAPASVVTYLGATWIAVAPMTGTAPGVTGGQWALLAARGADGTGIGTGIGDMVKATYDTVDRGYVDRAVLADTASALATPLKLDTIDAPTDTAALDANTTAHGLLKKLSGVATEFMSGTGAWSTPAGGAAGGVTSLVAGTGVTLSPTSGVGAVTINAAAPSGGGGLNPATGLDLIEDFISYNDGKFSLGWISKIIGTGTVSCPRTRNDGSELGVVVLSCPAVNDAACITLGDINTGGFGLSSDTILTITFRIKLVSTSGSTARVSFGLARDPGPVPIDTPSSGYWFSQVFAGNNATAWQWYTHLGGGGITGNTAIIPAMAVWNNYKIVCNPTLNSKFYINEALVGTSDNSQETAGLNPFLWLTANEIYSPIAMTCDYVRIQASGLQR